MVLEKILSKRKFRVLTYIYGAFLEVIGFSLLFAFDKTMAILHKNPIAFSIILIIAGYLMAVGVRKR